MQRIIDQALLQSDERIRPITIRYMPLSELTRDALDGILAGATPTDSLRIGLACSYQSYRNNVTLCMLAFATSTSALILQIPMKHTLASSELQDFFNTHQFYAFHAHTIALSLFSDLQLTVSSLVDLQSATPKNSTRDVYTTVQLLLNGSAIKIYQDNFNSLFEEDLLGSSDKERDNLAQRAWITHYLSRVDCAGPAITSVPVINTQQWSTEYLGFLSKSSKALVLQDFNKPRFTKHKFKLNTSKQSNRVELTSLEYQSRIRKTNHQTVKVEVVNDYGQHIVLPSKIKSIDGKKVVLSLPDSITSSQQIQNITTYGKAGLSGSELQSSLSLLHALQGKKYLLDNAWIQLIMFPNHPPNHTIDSFDPWQLSPSDSTFQNTSPQDLLVSPPLAFDYTLNDSQIDAVKHLLKHDNATDYTLIHGPPGTGKTTVITAFVNSILNGSDRVLWLVAKTNVAVKNIAEKLCKCNIMDWKLIISKEFFSGWHDHLYRVLPEGNIIIPTDQLHPISLKNCRVFLCTLSMLSLPKVQDVIKKVSLETLVIDEASQIEMGDYLPILSKFGNKIKKICFIGDDKQLPPYGSTNSDQFKLESIFEKFHLRTEEKFLNIQYRMPIPIGNFISKYVYDDNLLSNPDHPIDSKQSCQFFNIDNGQEEHARDSSFKNLKEVEAVIQISNFLSSKGRNFKILTPYDAQRDCIEKELQRNEMTWEDKCYNVDSFQGNEDDLIIISVVRSLDIGFLRDKRRSNVMLSRSKQGMYICSSAKFLSTHAKDTLLGQLAAEWSDTQWIEWEDIRSGNFYY